MARPRPVPPYLRDRQGQPVLRQGELVLVVEDNPAMRKMVVLQLRALNYRVIEAASVVSALEILEHESVQLVFTDIIMPSANNGST